ncbi:MAG: peptidylprolyl isomerase [Spirochaetia bacterium]|nr:peptidylprolyl isomerase [Spirochaetia bacterium]
MEISNNKVVAFNYVLKNKDGEILDNTENEPLHYIHGYGNIIPGLEKALLGKKKDDKFDITIPPEEAYGIRDDANVQKIERAQFEPGVEITEGMRFQSQTEAGMQIFTVIAVDDNLITLDGNHPLAGETLDFSVEVGEIRDATEEEIQHGHVHIPGQEH